ncbi:hypothetical protein F4861DRAFT_506248 [Xylaria intraflava]|nr:hypothetical protein F4861DRAFT_506248 [Xylaria intraflava]
MTSHRARVAVFLDQQLPQTCQIAVSLGYYPESAECLRLAHSSEYSGLDMRYNIDDVTKRSLGHDRFRRFVLLPLSWTALNFHDPEPAELRYSGMPDHTYRYRLDSTSSGCLYCHYASYLR